MRHALEPDHLAAVATLIDSGKRRIMAAAYLGAVWGLGHTLAILGLGGVLLILRLELPGRAQALLELSVAGMLVFLGGRGLYRAWRISRRPGEVHAHAGGRVHRHAGDSEHLHLGPFTVGLRPLAIGLVHGLAGTGALTSLVMATLPTFSAGLLYLASFGLGSLLGMALVTFAAGLSVHRIRAATGRAVLLSVAGLGSLSYGLFWGVQQLALLR